MSFIWYKLLLTSFTKSYKIISVDLQITTTIRISIIIVSGSSHTLKSYETVDPTDTALEFIYLFKTTQSVYCTCITVINFSAFNFTPNHVKLINTVSTTGLGSVQKKNCLNHPAYSKKINYIDICSAWIFQHYSCLSVNNNRTRYSHTNKEKYKVQTT